MHRRKPTQLFAAVAGGLLLAEAGTIVLALQCGARLGDGWLVLAAALALGLWTFLLAIALVSWAQHLLLRGVDAACGRLEAARSSAHVEILAAVPTLDLLGRALRRQDANLVELRDTLLAVTLAGRGQVPSAGGTKLARAAGLAAGALRTNADNLRLLESLEDWIVAARSRQEEVRELTTELRAALERVPEPVLARREAGDPVFGYSVADGAPAADEDELAMLPPALRERLRGAAPWDESSASEGQGRN